MCVYSYVTSFVSGILLEHKLQKCLAILINTHFLPLFARRSYQVHIIFEMRVRPSLLKVSSVERMALGFRALGISPCQEQSQGHCNHV